MSCVGAGLDTDPNVLRVALAEAARIGAPVRQLDRTSLRLTLVVPVAHQDALVAALHAALIEAGAGLATTPEVG